jgi:hypothetical protein
MYAKSGGLYAKSGGLDLIVDQTQMQYVNFVYGDDDETELHTAQVPDADSAYLEQVIAILSPLSAEDYMNGPAVILHSMAKYSYVLDGDTLYWCAEWQPGLLVVRFSPNGEMAWASIRSPVPDFGGRDADKAEWDAYNVEADNPQYNLVFDSWDAQFDDQQRTWKSFVPADSDVQDRFRAGLSRVNELGELMEKRFSQDVKSWADLCKKNLRSWCGDGVRLN